ncbi:methionyl-tRNA formyltransferase [Flavobacterium salilacus subsp. salilacus]|uniref:methionyl-tRNA formyltransferase n=1 Tax=Flavobacterium TaxID=237 RepID=UPI001074C4FD|nr:MULTISPECIES: methionyl-tRNA formyltransferase [Flavobacterium]KAF2519355.1 methionyl-tRNA formyltransferase [Flavobacterium salilacus subsp. salilacus]MBE1614754.1 methionyl-tRNA formyltransferase [Flavobacterium sp. SaA2.13]
MERLRIVFMGTPEFAVGILDAIYQNNYDIVGVITAPDRPAGRGQKVKYSAVKEYALEKNLKLLQPVNLKDEVFLQELEGLQANLQVVVAFRMLPAQVWKMPKLGTFNLHASLLPQYRGAAPINWAIINGEKTTGVTTFFIDDKIDTGAIILKEEIAIGDKETAGELHDRLMLLGVDAVLKTLSLIGNGQAETTIQPTDANIKTAYKLNKENCKIDWTMPGQAIYNLIRGLSPYPAAWTFINDNGQEWNVKVYNALFKEEDHDCEVGKLIVDKKEIKISVANGYIILLDLQFPGKKKMTAGELLNGMKFTANAMAK